jgi:DNA (cytosine-5)-methyltransferase 1
LHKKKLSLYEAISDLPPIINDQYPKHNDYISIPQNAYQLEMRKNSTALTEHYCSKYGTKMKEILELIPPNGDVSHLPIHLRPKSCFANTYARLFPNEPSPTITRNFGTPSSSRCIHPYQNRALTTREAARLQSFPDDYRFKGSQTSKHIQIGNAIPPLFGQIIANSIILSL